MCDYTKVEYKVRLTGKGAFLKLTGDLFKHADFGHHRVWTSSLYCEGVVRGLPAKPTTMSSEHCGDVSKLTSSHLIQATAQSISNV